MLRLAPHNFTFDPPQVVADKLTWPGAIACGVGAVEAVACYVAADTAIFQIGDITPVIDGLPSDPQRPLLISVDGAIFTTLPIKRGQIVRFDRQPDGRFSATPGVLNGIPMTAVGFALASNGQLWMTTNNQYFHGLAHLSIRVAPDDAAYGIAAYPDRADVAFPNLRGHLLITTIGSWNALTIAGYELWDVPLDGHEPNTARPIIPSDTDLNSSDASLNALTFYPDHPIAVAVDPRGWIYVATREGRLVRLRPRV